MRDARERACVQRQYANVALDTIREMFPGGIVLSAKPIAIKVLSKSLS